MILDFGFWILDWKRLPWHRPGPALRSGPAWKQSKIQNPKSKIAHLLTIAIFPILTLQTFAQQQAQLPWWDRAVERWIGPYWIKSDLPPEQVNALGRHLNVMHRECNRVLGSVPVRVQDKLNVLIFGSRDEWAFELRTRYAIKPPEEGGYFMSHADQVLAFWTDGLSPRQIEELIQREAFRQFAYNRFGTDMPRWLSEGLAEVFGEAVLIGDSLMIGHSTERVVMRLKDAVNDGKYVPFQTMLNITEQEWKDAQKELSPAWMQAQSRSMALFAMHSIHAESFARYLRHLNNGLPADHAWARTFGPDSTEIESRWKQFVDSAGPSALATAMERAEFLAEGALELSRRKVFPQSLAELKKALREIKFTRTIKNRHEEITWSADDDSLFEIPKDDLSVQKPLFIVGKSRLPPTRREQALEKDNPTPAAISTQHLRPTGVQVKWIRDAENKSFSYQILVR